MPMTDKELDELVARLKEPIPYVGIDGIPRVVVHNYLREAAAAITQLREERESNWILANLSRQRAESVESEMDAIYQSVSDDMKASEARVKTLEAELAASRAHVVELRAEVDRYMDTAEASMAQRMELTERVQKAELDTGRLDWLESTRTSAEMELCAPCGWYVDESGAPILRGEVEAMWSRTLRAAIDAAIAREKEGK